MGHFKSLQVFTFLFITLSFGFANAATTLPRKLNRGETWTLNVNPGTKQARIWPRTKCNFDGSGSGKCQTGDCGGLLQCKVFGQPPNTLAEYSLNHRGIKCTADINGQCPNQLKAPGGCHNPCTVFKTEEYCCNSGKCGPTNLSRFFKDRCRDAYSYPKDDPTSTFTYPEGTNYRVIFCP
ncbi:hypothetical protein FNV43_RR07317 [Rhamnella rubrinervis]|uniref:Thaumatin-like protein n=1 Tax=Rhamnella rubrinervis TaxID=2594499 RepID=A0A8K0HFI4_9ROSA|nr:hypothetical protein FNV43_RR07317 [Rhamnella rubrinervis]